MALKTGDKAFNSFRGGRYTRSNLTNISDDHVLIANQVMFPGDGIAHKRPGYTLVAAALGFNPKRIFDFARQTDLKQFVILQGGGKIAWIPAAGGIPTIIAQGEDANLEWDFSTNTFGLYGSNGLKAYRWVDTGGGALTKFNWGIQPPVSAPSVSTIAGTLTLTAGRQYAFSYVSKWTDSLGVTRVHVGPPSALSPSTNAVANVVVLLQNLLASADPQVTHIWIWSTNDTPFNTTSVLFFNAEIVNGTTSYGDSLQDTSLDTTRQAPYENFPVPAANILFDFQGRIVLSGIPGRPDLVQATGLEEVVLGIPQETAPPSVFFNVPGGIKKVTGGKTFNETLMISTSQFWFSVSGLDAQTFSENDNIFQPGAAGKDLIVVTPAWLAWLGSDKKLWAWNGSGEPLEISWKIAKSDGSQQLSMEAISDATLAGGKLLWHSFGRYNFIILLCSSQNNNYYDWCQLWDVSVLTGPAGPMGAITKDGMLLGAAEGDAFFADSIIGAGNVLVGNTPYVFLADSAGNLYRFPDGFTDNGKLYGPVVGSEYTDGDAPGIVKRWRWMDVITSRIDAAAACGASAIASDGVQIDALPYTLVVTPLPAQYGTDPTTFRAKLEAKGSAVGRYMRWFVELPVDDQDSELLKVEVKFSPVGKDSR